ncbi:MAG: hypothetical protein M0D53_11280 [Flavobacterium sp. JAD_PAG50586_2]|nr:MAG: hypothetical protein M0D53_11280 [Flavobacterium sp. JAD_PAG50586_2]
MKKLILLFSLLVLNGCSKSVISTQSGLRYRVLEKGSGINAKAGDEVFIYETTSYRNGTVLYSNYNSTLKTAPVNL